MRSVLSATFSSIFVLAKWLDETYNSLLINRYTLTKNFLFC